MSRIGLDTSKPVVQLRGVDAAEAVVLRRTLRRKEMVTVFETLAPTVVAIEACGASGHWARLLPSFGPAVTLIPPQLVKPPVERGKNDAADAEALCEAMEPADPPDPRPGLGQLRPHPWSMRHGCLVWRCQPARWENIVLPATSSSARKMLPVPDSVM